MRQIRKEYHITDVCFIAEKYEVVVDWHQLKTATYLQPLNRDEEPEGIESKQRWSYVKVNMDGVIVGRKICILDDMDYFSLALQLEDMFGMYICMSEIKLIKEESNQPLIYLLWFYTTKYIYCGSILQKINFIFFFF